KNSDATLFNGYDGRLSIDENGKLKVNRSYHEQVFDYVIPENKEVNITVVGTQQVTKLYVDGQLEDALIRRSDNPTDYEYLMSTFVFPLKQIGEAFHGKLANIHAYKKAMNPQQVLDTF